MPTAQEIYQQINQARQEGRVLGGPVFPMMGVMPSIIAGVQGLFGDDPKRYVDGQEVLAGQIPWGKPGRIPQERLDQWINERNKLFHATQPDAVESILQEGKINPSSYWASFEKDAPPHLKNAYKQLKDKANQIDDEYNNIFQKYNTRNAIEDRIKRTRDKNIYSTDEHNAYLQTLNNLSLQKSKLLDAQNQMINDWYKSPELKRIQKQTAGVSVSRVPKASGDAYGEAPVTFELNPSKIPVNRPFAELGWGKTQPVSKAWTEKTGEKTIYNPRFEFENRTYNQPIPKEAVTKAMIDRSLLRIPGMPEGGSTSRNLIRALTEHNIPIEYFENARAMHSYRARIGEDVKRKLLEKALGVGQ